MRHQGVAHLRHKFASTGRVAAPNRSREPELSHHRAVRLVLRGFRFRFCAMHAPFLPRGLSRCLRMMLSVRAALIAESCLRSSRFGVKLLFAHGAAEVISPSPPRSLFPPLCQAHTVIPQIGSTNPDFVYRQLHLHFPSEANVPA